MVLGKNGIKEAIDDGTADILSVSKGVNTGSMTSKITPNDLEGREKAYEKAKELIK